MFPDDDVVGDLDQIVDLSPALDPGPAEGGSIDRAVGPDLHVVINLNDPHLRDLDVPSLLILGKTKTITADDRATVNNDSIADFAPVENGYARVDQAMIADLTPAPR